MSLQLTTSEICHLFAKGEGFRVLAEVDNSAMDGGCLIVAKAFILAYGRGSLVRIVRLSEANGKELFTDHYGALIDGEILDGVGRHKSPDAWINIFRWDTAIHAYREGYDADSEIPDDPALSKALASVITRTRDAKGKP